MSKSKIHSVSTISSIFLFALLAIFITFLITHVYFGAQFMDEKDIFNWVGLVIEIGVAAGITGAIWYYTKTEQKKTNDLVENIQKITEKLDSVINEQHKLHHSRKKFLHECLFGDCIQTLICAYNINRDKPSRDLVLQDGTKVGELSEYQSLQFTGKILNERISQFGDLMEPELYASVSTVRNLLHEQNIKKNHMESIIQQSKRIINALDESLFSKDHIEGIEILDKV